jgi:hypothetical protein
MIMLQGKVRSLLLGVHLAGAGYWGAGLVVFANTADALEIQPKPLPPAWELLNGSCKSHEGGWTICTPSFDRYKALVGKSADATGNKRHIMYAVHKQELTGEKATVKTELLEQLVFDCKARKAFKRFVGSRIDIGGGKGWERIIWSSNDKWKEASSVHAKMIRTCPAFDGYQRLGEAQVDLKNTISSDKNININGITDSGVKYVMTIDCKNLVFGINSAPRKPIVPGSLGSELHSRLCKAIR